MKRLTRGSYALLLLVAVLISATYATEPVANAKSPAWPRPELQYLEAVNRVGPPRDPQLLYLLMAQYANANLRAEGVEFFGTLLKELEPRLTDPQKAEYLGALALLRAGHANDVALFKRLGWVKQTIRMLEQAKQLAGDEVYTVRWMAGVVYAQLPGFFGQKTTALADLTWCLEHADRAPHLGWLREVYYQLATLLRADGDAEKARHYLQLSGYPDFDKPITLTTPYAEELETGHTFASKRITEVVPHKVYALSGYEFTEYYFVVSDDGRQLIAIDAGTRPDSAEAAYQALRAYAPNLPQLTTLLITHGHWDHLGGHSYFRALNPHLKVYARNNYREEMTRALDAPERFSSAFFGTRFRTADVRTFEADITIDRKSDISIGGTRIEIIPVQGGETHDALFFHLPDHRVMFVGDFIMPYLGAPFVEEGNLAGLLDAIDVVARYKPRYLLHGHEPLTRLYASATMLTDLKPHLIWLQREILAAIKRGDARASLHERNLIPPGLLEGNPDVHLPYLVMRENVINRIYDQNVGYWQQDLQGLDHLSNADRGTILIDYLDVSEAQLLKATERMIADGKHELAATTLAWTKDRFPESKPLSQVERLTYLKLMEKYADFNPFKFILYSNKIGVLTPPITATTSLPVKTYDR